MKTYNVTFSTANEVLSDFQVEAKNLIEAKKIAQFHKRHFKTNKRFSIDVRLDK